jgi:hypothetical protein
MVLWRLEMKMVYSRSCLLLLLCLPLVAGGGVRHHRNAETGLSSWKIEDRGFSLELVQLVPTYVQAVFASRGLPPEVVAKVGSYCVFGTIVRNLSDAPLSNLVADWRYITADGVAHAPKTKSAWVSEWRELGVAFRWLMLPEDQTYEAGDWGQGFTTVKLPPGTVFELSYAWSLHGETYRGSIEGLRCGPAEPE